MVKVLHTSDWHVGKTIRGNSRSGEHRAVLGEIAAIALREEVDLVVVAGDLFETSAPTPEAEEIVWRALLDLADTGATVAVISGNHDSAHRLRAVAPLLALGRIHLLTEPTRPDLGGVVRLALRSGELGLAMLPFVSQRGIVHAEQLMADAAYEHAQLYAERLGQLIGLLCAALPPDLPSLLLTHAFVAGGTRGGGERHAHLVDEYAVMSHAFPATLGYVAVGHLHRAQKLPGATAIHYCGSPLQLDFGEVADAKQVNLVELRAGVPAKVSAVPLTGGTPLVTLDGSLAQIASLAAALDGPCWIRARVDEPRRAGLADEVRDAMGDHRNALVDVHVVASESASGGPTVSDRHGQTPRQLFDAFLASRTIDDPRLGPAFDALHDELTETSP